MKRSLRHLLLLPFLLLGCWLGYWLLVDARQEPVPSVIPQEKAPPSPPLASTGLTFSTYIGENLDSRVKIAAMRVVPRQLSAFRMKDVNELLMFDIAIDSFLDDQGSAELLPVDDLHRQLTGIQLKGLGRITQVRMETFRSTFFREKRPILMVRAREGLIDFARHKTVLHDAVLVETATGRQIVGKTVYWEKETKRFMIPGQYRLSDGRKRQQGEAIAVGLDFAISPLEKETKR